ncbi:transcription factor TFIIE beta subunit, TFIIEB, Tfa2 [Coemansia sp. IMI 203386]|nr:transcription factor TFIIE beta subunit, TFIIEB, Tfa2 [Coemansia sp. IMI 203386]
MSDLIAGRKGFSKAIANQPVYQQKRIHAISTQLSTYRERQPANEDTNKPKVTLSSDSGVLTRVHQIIDFLKKSQRPCTVDEIRLHVSEFTDDGPEFRHLSNNAKVIYNQRDNAFAYKPEYNIRTAEELLDYLRAIPDGGGLEVKKLSDSYLSEYSKVVAELRKRHLVLATTDNDDRPKYIYYNHMVIDQEVDEELKTNWDRMVVPDEPELGREMKRAGLGQARVELREVKEQKDVKKAKKASSRKTKLTNTHLGDLIDLTKDYVPDSR